MAEFSVWEPLCWRARMCLCLFAVPHQHANRSYLDSSQPLVTIFNTIFRWLQASAAVRWTRTRGRSGEAWAPWPGWDLNRLLGCTSGKDRYATAPNVKTDEVREADMNTDLYLAWIDTCKTRIQETHKCWFCVRAEDFRKNKRQRLHTLETGKHKWKKGRNQSHPGSFNIIELLVEVQISGWSLAGSEGRLEEGRGRGSGFLWLLFDSIQRANRITPLSVPCRRYPQSAAHFIPFSPFSPSLLLMPLFICFNFSRPASLVSFRATFPSKRAIAGGGPRLKLLRRSAPARSETGMSLPAGVLRRCFTPFYFEDAARM